MIGAPGVPGPPGTAPHIQGGQTVAENMHAIHTYGTAMLNWLNAKVKYFEKNQENDFTHKYWLTKQDEFIRYSYIHEMLKHLEFLATRYENDREVFEQLAEILRLTLGFSVAIQCTEFKEKF